MKRLTNKKSTEKTSSYKILFETYKAKVYRVACYILKNEQDSKDIVQEAFIIAYKKMDTLRDPSKFEGWICTIACNLAKDKYRKRKREILTDSYEKIIPFSDSVESFVCYDELLEKKELKEKILEHIHRLDSHYRNVILLYYYLELSYDEIAKTLDISSGTVKSRIFRAKKILQSNMLKDNDNESIILEVRRGKNA